ncbi:hypothetical protein ACXIUS_04055 [Bosea thiooxidans]
MTRFALILTAGLILAACSRPRDGDDFMDGRGVAAGVQYELQRTR